MTMRLLALRADSALPPGIFVVLISVGRRVNPRAIVRLEGLGKLKKITDLIGNGAHDLPACSIMPQPAILKSLFCSESVFMTKI
jgi:hypothetical protein